MTGSSGSSGQSAVYMSATNAASSRVAGRRARSPATSAAVEVIGSAYPGWIVARLSGGDLHVAVSVALVGPRVVVAAALRERDEPDLVLVLVLHVAHAYRSGRRR